jgi:hypothetical protein
VEDAAALEAKQMVLAASIGSYDPVPQQTVTEPLRDQPRGNLDAQHLAPGECGRETERVSVTDLSFRHPHIFASCARNGMMTVCPSN